MRYICSAFNACYNHPCGDAGGAQCLFNSTSGSFYCEYNVTSCDEGVKCQHCGTCVDQADGYSCQCGEHYIGRHCGVYDYCWSNPCQNGATCSSSGFGFFFSYYCLCANNFYGDWCQYKTSTCHVTTCPSGMQCVESDQSAFCVAEDRLGTAKCVSSTIAGEWLTESMFTSNFVNQLSQYVRPYVSINGSIACGCDDVTSDACEYDVNECASDPCLNGDTCLDRVQGYECPCGRYRRGLFLGVHCETLHGTCDPDPCQNGGSCVTNGYRTRCSCESMEFEGEYCHEINQDQCLSDPCVRGECIDEINGYQCNCSGTGYAGQLCEINIDVCPHDEEGNLCQREANECDSNPCRHGSCVDKVLEYQCSCDTGYTGTNCETDIDECASDPCVYGRCTDKLNRYKCRCIPGFSGERCDVGPCSSNPCLNNGTCRNVVKDRSYQCACTDQFAGPQCELIIESRFSNASVNATKSDDSEETNKSNNWIYYVTISVVSGLFVFASFIT